MEYFPGTVIKRKGINTESFFEGLFACGDINQSQLSHITGLLQPTIQNWVNRGFVSRGKAKGFSKDRTARIFIVNMLRGSMPLDKISDLLYYINGDTEDLTDDIISESQLYLTVCKILFSDDFSIKNLDNAIENVLENYQATQSAKTRLSLGLKVIIKAVFATDIINGLNDSFVVINQYCQNK